MDIILKQKFDLETRNNGDLAEKFYQDKLLSPSVIFAIKHQKAAVRYSKIFKYANPSVYLLLVREDNYIQIWYEKEELVKSSQGKEGSPKREILEEEEAATQQAALIDQEFVTVCQELLMDHLGPFSKIIIKKNISKKPQLSRNEFIANLISDVSTNPHSEELVRKLEKLSSEGNIT